MYARTDQAATTVYRRALAAAMQGRVLDEDNVFCCAHGPVCRRSVGRDGFAAGQLSYVGDHYAAESIGMPLRILIVSMQQGDDEAPVTLERRREQIHGRVPQAFGERNQHMAGVTTALRILFGGAPGADRDGEVLDTPNGAVHVLDAYAMANSVLCSRRPGAGREGAPSQVMLANCAEHLRATVTALEPTIIHSQGRAQSSSTHQAIERIADDLQAVDEHVSRLRVGGVEAVWCSLRHPARNWGQLGRSYLHEVAAPALRTTRQLAIGG